MAWTPYEYDKQLNKAKVNLLKSGIALPQDKSPRGFLDRLFDALSVGQYATMGTIRNLQEGKNPLEGFIGGIKAANPFGRGYEKGEASFGDVLQNAGVTNPYVKGIGGFVGDVLLDPTTYIGAGAIKAAGKGIVKGASAAKKALVSIPKVGGTIEKGLEAAKAPINWTRKAFQYGYNVNPNVLDLVKKTQTGIGLKNEEAIQVIADIFKNKKLGKADYELITKSIDNPNAYKVPKRLQQTKKDVQQFYSAIKKERQQGGILGEGLENYINRMYTRVPKNEKVLNQYTSKFATNDPHMKKRVFETLDEAKEAGFEFETNTPKLMLGLSASTNKTLANKKLLNELKSLGEDVIKPVKKTIKVQDNATGEWIEKTVDDIPIGWKETVIPQFKGYAFEKDAADFLNNFYRINTSDEAVSQFKKGWDSINGLWKSFALGTPRYVVRNMADNFTKNWLAGIKPTGYVYASKMMAKPAEKFTITLKNGKKVGSDKILDIAKKNNLIGSGQFSADLNESMFKKLENKIEGFRPINLVNPNPEKNIAMQGLRKAGQVTEDWSKLSHFVGKLIETGDVKNSVESVRKFLFDYSDITAFQQKAKSFFPFFTFMSKNVPLMAEQLLKQPGKFAAIPKAKRAIEGEPGKQDVPDYIKENYMVNLGRAKGGKDYYLTHGLSFTDLNKLNPNELIDTLLNSLTPVAKLPVELAMNRSAYYKGDIEQYPGQTTNIYGKEIPKKLEYILQSIPALNTAMQVGKAPKGQRGKPENLAPVFRTLGFPVNTYDVQKYQNSEKYKKIEQLRRILSQHKKAVNK